MTSILPDAEAVVSGLLSDVDDFPAPPKMLASRVPCRVIYKIGGAAVDRRFLDAPHIQVTSYDDNRDAAKALAEKARDDLFTAWRTQYRGPNGGIHRVVEVVSPFENRAGSVDGVFRFDATYEVQTRP